MPGAARTGWPRTATLVAVAAAGVALGAAGAAAASALSDEAEPDLLFGGLDVQVEGRTDLERMTVGLSVNNHGAADFRIADVRIPGWTLAEPIAVDNTIPAGRWTSLSFDLVVDCSVSVLDPGVEVVGADGVAIAAERDATARRLASTQQRTCLQRDMPAPGLIPAVERVSARTDTAGGVAHVDIDVVHEAASELDFQLAAVTGHASGFTVELQDRLTELAAGATTAVTTDWRVRDCGGAAGTTGTGVPDPSSSGNFDGLVLHLYWDDPAGSTPIRTDLPVDLPPDVVVSLARFAVTECRAGHAGT